MMNVRFLTVGIALTLAFVARANGGELGAHTPHGMVASDSATASAIGARVLAAGGNAADAACATALALGVVHPFASGLGGGGMALIYQASANQVFALDFRETAPKAVGPESFKRPGQSVRGGLAVGVPGEPAGLAELVRRWGKHPFAQCVKPAERLAHAFPASPWLVEHVQQALTKDPGETAFLSEALELKATTLSTLQPGQQLHRTHLAKTLAQLRRDGASALYVGSLARELVTAVTEAGGVMTMDDLAHYRPIERTPLLAQFRGHRIYLMPPPSSGGVLIAQALGILDARDEPWDKAGPASPDYLHLLTEALKHGFADRSRHMGDPDFVQIPLAHLLDKATLRSLAARIQPDRVLATDDCGSPSQRPAAPARDAGTAHISVVDAEGNAVALTTTINLEFGAHLMGGKTGIVLNDEMDDFATSPKPDAFGLQTGAANAVAPNKRPLSSMSPTIAVGDQGVEVVVGAAGGPTIISSTLQVLLDVLVFHMPAQAAVNAPRIHHQWMPAILNYEPACPASTVDILRGKGHQVVARKKIGKVNLIVRSPAGLDAAAEPRSRGAPARR
jgi:gamma-glutamyltranspeptidase/glutathione hydrolase